MHPLIYLADTMPLEGDPVAELRAEFERQMHKVAFGKLYSGDVEKRMELIAAVLLGEYILSKRIEALSDARDMELGHDRTPPKSIFPIPAGGKKITVKAKGPK